MAREWVPWPMGALFVPGLDLEVHDLAVFRHGIDLGLGPDLHAHRGGGLVGDVQVNAHAALAVGEIVLQGGHGGVFHHGSHEGGAEHRQGAGADLCGGQFLGDDLFQAAFGSNENHGKVLLVIKSD